MPTSAGVCPSSAIVGLAKSMEPRFKTLNTHSPLRCSRSNEEGSCHGGHRGPDCGESWHRLLVWKQCKKYKDRHFNSDYSFDHESGNDCDHTFIERNVKCV